MLKMLFNLFTEDSQIDRSAGSKKAAQFDKKNCQHK